MTPKRDRSKKNPHLETVIRTWDVLPWHVKARILAICEFHFMKHKIKLMMRYRIEAAESLIKDKLAIDCKKPSLGE